MTVALLAGYAVAAGFAVPACLRREWTARMPRLAMTLWLALAGSWVTSVTLAALALAMPSLLTWPAHGTPGFPTVSHLPIAIVTGIALGATLVLWTAIRLVCDLRKAWREQNEHASFLAATGCADRITGALVLDDDVPAAYSLPRGQHRIVVSSATLAVLNSGQLAAVLSHERAHLRGHHQFVLTLTKSLAHAFPVIPLLARAAEEVAVLAEMAADAAAIRRHDAEDLAAALVILARARSRAAALAGGPALTAGGPAALARVNQLLAAGPPPVRAASLAAGLAVLAMAVAFACLPVVVVACGLLA